MSADLIDRAKQAAGNWMKFSCFAWHVQPDYPERWAIVYTHNRDSRLLEESNADAIADMMKPHVSRGTARAESHSHWAVGHVDGYAIKVFTSRGKITEAFKAWCAIQDSLDNYPVLDEEDYSRREYEATLENITNEGRAILPDEVPDDWASQVFSWLWENNQSAVENRDDQGGYPSREQIEEALTALQITPELADL